MRRFCALLGFFIVINCNSVSYSQGLSAGFFSGINISDIHGNSYSGKWKFKPGPVQGVFIDFNPGRYFGFSTGMNYSTNYYEHKAYSEYYYPLEFTFSSSSFAPIYYTQDEVMDFSFITIPAQLKFIIPSKLALTISPGIFWSIVQDYNVTRHFMYEPAKGDFGFIYSAGLSYPITRDFDILLRVRYMIGRKDFYESVNYRHGSFDLNLGVSFSGIFEKTGETTELKVDTDTVKSRLTLVYFAGTNLSWNSYDKGGNYSYSAGPSAGFRIDIPIGTKTEFRTGLSFEQTGYTFNDSSDVFYGYNIVDDAQYLVDARTTIDYIEIPASLKFNIGRKNRLFINTGPYLAVKLNARTTGEAFSEVNSSSTFRIVKHVIYDDIERLIRDNDTGWAFGTGLTIPLFGKCNAEVGLQYKTGFRDIFDAASFSGSNLYDNKITVIRNRSLSVHLGFKVPVSK